MKNKIIVPRPVKYLPFNKIISNNIREFKVLAISNILVDKEQMSDFWKIMSTNKERNIEYDIYHKE